MNVMFKYVFLFVLFGTVLEQTGATSYVINFARRLFRNSDGGPAKVAVVSSGLMGSLSGSAVANTATTGSFTIPLMKSTGFNSETAAGIEAAASSGGALMPPIMGAGAYMMLEILSTIDPEISYLKIIQAALIPAMLYYFALLLAVHFHAKRIGATTEASRMETSDDDMPMDEENTRYQGFVFFGSFVILIAMLLWGFTPFLAVSVSLVGICLLAAASKTTRLGARELAKAMVAAAKSGTSLIVAASCVGIILGVVDMSGLGPALPAKVQVLAGDSAMFALLSADGIHDYSWHGVTFSRLLPAGSADSQLRARGSRHAPAGGSSLHLLLRYDVDGNAPRCVSSLCRCCNCRRQHHQVGVRRLPIRIGRICSAVFVCVQAGIINAYPR